MKIVDAVFVYHMQNEDDIRWHGRIHAHGTRNYEVHYFLQGHGIFRNGPSKLHITPGSFFITAPEIVHAISAASIHDPITYYAILLELSEDEKELRELLKKEEKPAAYDIGTNYRFFFEEIKEKGLSPNENLQKSAAHQLIAFLYQLSEGLPHNYGTEESIHLEKALRFMQNHVMDDITLSDIAKNLRLTESYFIRLFKRRMHITPMKYYTKLKIEAAGAMLTCTDISVKELADRLHFYSEFHFSRIFKQYTGLAPSYYRKNYLQSIGYSKADAAAELN